MTKGLIRTASVMFAALGIGGPALAQQFFLYPPCDVNVAGTLRARATIAATAGVRSREDRHVLDAQIPITDASMLQFSGGGAVAAGLRGEFNDLRCRTGVLSEAAGRLRYAYGGDASAMRLVIGSYDAQRDIIRRDPTSAGPGGPVTARSIFDLAGHNQMRLAVPFSVGGGDGASIHVHTFTLRRADSGPSDGYAYAEWAIHADLDGDCTIGDGEPLLATGVLRVGPNERAAADPVRFESPRGHYVLSVTKEMSADLGVASRSCASSARAASEITEVMTLALTLIPGP
jgi:hypothetical protein